LSEQIAVALPIVSHASRWRTKLLSCIIFCQRPNQYHRHWSSAKQLGLIHQMGWHLGVCFIKWGVKPLCLLHQMGRETFVFASSNGVTPSFILHQMGWHPPLFFIKWDDTFLYSSSNGVTPSFILHQMGYDTLLYSSSNGMTPSFILHQMGWHLSLFFMKWSGKWMFKPLCLFINNIGQPIKPNLHFLSLSLFSFYVPCPCSHRSDVFPIIWALHLSLSFARLLSRRPFSGRPQKHPSISSLVYPFQHSLRQTYFCKLIPSLSRLFSPSDQTIPIYSF